MHLVLFLESIPAMCYQRKCWIEEHQLPQLHPKRHFLMKSRIDKKIISTPCSFSPKKPNDHMWRRRNKTFLTKTKAIWCGKLAFWAFQLCNWQKPIPSTLAPPISLDMKISSLSALVPWWSPGPNRRRSELLLQSKATRSPGHRRPSRYHGWGSWTFILSETVSWLVISHIFASCMWRCGGSFNSIRQGDFLPATWGFFSKRQIAALMDMTSSSH